MDEEDVVGFARKYRPSRFEDYIGNQKVKETVYNTLRNATESGKSFPQKIMLTGATGCGKTTLARIIVREYMCENRDPVMGACGECGACLECDYYIQTGRAEDIQDVDEIDITINGGKADIERINEEIQVLPMRKWRVMLFDEVHQATEQAQNAMLKTFEEPPAHALIIIATTNPEKLLPTLVNRFNLRLEIQKPSIKELVAHLKNICSLENIPNDNEGLRIISARANRIIRDALNLLEHVASSRKSAEVSSVVEEFDEVADSDLQSFLSAYQAMDTNRFTTILYRIGKEKDLRTFHKSLMQYINRGIYIANGVSIDGLTSDEVKAYKELFDKFSAGDLARILASMRRMTIGDIEANFMAFLYDSERFLLTDTSRLEASAHRPSRTGTAPTMSSEVRSRESMERSSSRDLLDRGRRASGEDILASATSTVASEDIFSRLGAQKVRNSDGDNFGS